MLSSYEMDVIWGELYDLERAYGVRFDFTFHRDPNEYRLVCRKGRIICSNIVSCDSIHQIHSPVLCAKRQAEKMAKEVCSIAERQNPYSMPKLF